MSKTMFMIGFVCGHCNGRQSHRNYQARRGDAAFLYEYLCIIIPVFCSLSFIDVYNYRVICQWERQSIFSPADSWLLRGNIGFTAWPSMATAMAIAIVDHLGPRFEFAKWLTERSEKATKRLRPLVGHRHGTVEARQRMRSYFLWNWGSQKFWESSRPHLTLFSASIWRDARRGGGRGGERR